MAAATMSRRLTESLEALSHVTAVLALNDKIIATIAEDRAPRAVLQFPSVMDWRAHVSPEKAIVSVFAPDWVNLQFACYRWAHQGLLLGFSDRVVRIAGARPAPLSCFTN